MKDRKIVGVEALSRFDTEGGTGPEEIFLKAAETGMGLDLELATLAVQMQEAPFLPDEIYLSVNASAELICDERFRAIIPPEQMRRLVVEVTEHSLAEDEDLLQRQIIALHQSGARIAIDDVGAGYSGLQRIAKLGPDILKIDRSIVTGVEANISQRAVVAALVHFAEETGARVLVEGVESEDEAQTLMELGVELAQGWLFGKPAGLAELFPQWQPKAGKSAVS